ncbi:phytase [Flavobacterium aquidurense]|uniref:3-phytase (Myo-inositol-hexaphosphate 3-phosphohydrolase) n=1 Tax=Flavobacterium aquidurense TaxID=362413 RepID=A0A0Q0W2H0_9FLAO|nr:phytase [Flavobacterium aquidurense]KQB38534.1 3-phytase (Myo-inositol-hexaphosphate 3-phosphohydrolase) [Flavobacterium aquidurense]
MKNKTIIAFLLLSTLFTACKDDKLAPIAANAVKPTVVTQALPHDTDDPSIWIHPTDASKSIIVGTDKDTDGALYAFDLKGKIVAKSEVLKRPNNVDIAYGLVIHGKKVDVAVTTERESNKIRVFSLPDLKAIDNGGIAVFEGEELRDPMGIALYTRKSDGKIFAIVGRKSGPSGSYLWQYELSGNGKFATAKVVRKFGAYSGKKEIEAIAVDNELGTVLYCDEQFGIRKYKADPALNDNKEIALFGKTGFKADNEGIAIYKKTDSTGYILVSNQQANTFMVYPREGTKGNPNDYPLLAEIPTSTIECDGADVTSINLGGNFKNGLFVAMSNGMTFHYYAWDLIQKRIDDKK